MADDKHIADLVQDTNDDCTPMHFVYHIKSDEYFIVRDDGRKERFPVRRIKGHFDRNNHYIIESISEPR